MSRLVLVRHGQARAFEDDSDRLSELGERQAQKLGDYFTARNLTWREAYCGTLVRQRATAERMGVLPRTDARLNEYDATGVLNRIAPAMAANDPKFAALFETAAQQRHTPDANRHFQRMFEVLMTRWRNGEVDVAGVETWQAFQARVRDVLYEIVHAPGDSRTVLVVSSGGAIATAVQIALSAPPATALELNWRMRNTSITEFLFSRGRITLDLFNAVPHLEPHEITYR